MTKISGSRSAFGLDQRRFLQRRPSGYALGEPYSAEFAGNTWLIGQTVAELQKLAPFLEKVMLAARSDLYQPEILIDNFYFPETAVVSEFQILPDGRTVGVSLTGSGGVLGLPAISGAYPAINWAQVLIPGTAYKINAETLRKAMFGDQALQRAVFEHLNFYISRLARRGACNKYHSLEERVCTLLLELQRCRNSGELPITQEQMAQFLGTQRASVSVTAYSLKSIGVIDYRRKNLTIIDHRKLQKLACECYRAGGHI